MDRKALRELYRDVVPLERDRRVRGERAAPASSPASTRGGPAQPGFTDVVDDGAHMEGRRSDVGPRTLRQLGRGEFPVGATLDLHGRGIDAARSGLGAFLREARAQRAVCVLVIHGKGEHSPGGVGVLRGEVAGWLTEGPASEHVSAFATATRADGGTGAVYVLLRRAPPSPSRP